MHSGSSTSRNSFDLPGTVCTERRCQQRAAMALWPVPDDGTIECWQINLREARRSQTDSEVLLAVSLGSFEYVEVSTCNSAQWRRDPREPGKLTCTVRISIAKNQLSNVSAHPFLPFLHHSFPFQPSRTHYHS